MQQSFQFTNISLSKDRQGFMKFMLITALLVFSVVGSYAQAFRCGQELVPDKASFYQVRRICGEPIDIHQWIEHRVASAPAYDQRPISQRRHFPNSPQTSIPVIPIVIPINVEEWTYDFGPTQFMRVFRFENGRLRRIIQLEKGETQ